MTRIVNDNGPTETSQITISTWVYLSSKSVKTQNTANANISAPAAGPGVLNRIPVIEFGQSVEPRVGIGIGFTLTYEHFLGQGYWSTVIGAPSWPDYFGTFWIGGLGTGRDGWFPFATGKAYPSVSYYKGYTHPEELYGFADGAVATVAESAFYPSQIAPPYLDPEPGYSSFNDEGINLYGVVNKNFGTPFVRAAYSLLRAYPITWTWQGHFTVSNNIQWPRVAVKDGDQAQESRQVNSKVLFVDFYSDNPFQWTMVPVPTPQVGIRPEVRVDTGGTGKYYAFGQLVVLIPERQGVTYGKPAIPSALYLDGGTVVFLLTGKWPEQTTMSDQEIVPTLKFAGGQFILDSWNHIFFTCDLTKMLLTGGQDDPTKREWVDTLAGKQEVSVPLSPPDMATPPEWAMLVNGKRVTSTADNPNPTPQLTVYPSNGGHWSSTPNFKMALAQVGMPNIQQEVGRYKVTGPNADIEYAYTHIWLNKYINPTKENLSKFYWPSKNPKYNNVIPPPDKKAAVKAFGKPDVWLYRDKANNVKFENLGTLGKFTLTGTAPKDFRPGPGQPVRKKPTTP